MRVRTSLSLFALSLLPCSALAQGGFSNPNFFDEYDFAWTYQPAFHRVEVANMDGDHSLDVFISAGSDIAGIPNAGFYDQRSLAPISGHDLAVVPGSGTGGRDSLVVANASGLHELWLDPMPSGEGFLWQQTTVVTAVWNNVDRMLVKNIGGYAEEDLMGLDGTDDKTFHFLLRNPSDAWVYFPSFTAPNVVQNDQFDLIDADLDGIQDVAVVSSYGLEVLDYSANVEWSVADSGTPGELVAYDSGGVQYIAWVREPAGGGQELVILDRSGNAEPAVTLTGVNDVVSIDAGDVDGDGEPDLLIVQADSVEAYVLIHQGGPTNSYGFDTTDTDVTRTFDWGVPGTDPLMNSATPAFHDLNRDGFADVVQPSEDEPRVRFQDGAGIIEASTSDPVVHVEHAVDGNSEHYVDITVNYGLPSGTAPEMDAVFIMYFRSSGFSGTVTTDNVGPCSADGNPNNAFNVRVNLGSTQVPTLEDYYFEMELAPAEYLEGPPPESEKGPGLEDLSLGRSKLYQFTLTGVCSTWPDGFGSCPPPQEVKVLLEEGQINGSIVGAFAQTQRISYGLPNGISYLPSSATPSETTFPAAE